MKMIEMKLPDFPVIKPAPVVRVRLQKRNRGSYGA